MTKYPKCPYCKTRQSYYDAYASENPGQTHCIKCKNEIDWALQIYPKSGAGWRKPINMEKVI